MESNEYCRRLKTATSFIKKQSYKFFLKNWFYVEKVVLLDRSYLED